eukprot:338654_1
MAAVSIQNHTVLETEHLTNNELSNITVITTENVSKYWLCGVLREWHVFRWLSWIVFMSLSVFMCVLASFYYSFNEKYYRQKHYKMEKPLVYLHILPAFWS